MQTATDIQQTLEDFDRQTAAKRSQILSAAQAAQAAQEAVEAQALEALGLENRRAAVATEKAAFTEYIETIQARLGELIADTEKLDARLVACFAEYQAVCKESARIAAEFSTAKAAIARERRLHLQKTGETSHETGDNYAARVLRDSGALSAALHIPVARWEHDVTPPLSFLNGSTRVVMK